ncbi:MAG: hypothetical protein OEZ02_10210 [Anaerolineae bacterium]|nr:hypothetical protein [Anaerolineae bacterium]
MTGHYKTRTALSMLFVIFAAFSYAVTGFASSELAPTGDGTPGNSVVSGFAIKNITYDLSTIDPSKIARVQMTVETEGGRQNAAHVTISADSGNTWVTCRNASGFLWTCDFPPTHELSVSQYSNLRVVAKN